MCIREGWRRCPLCRPSSMLDLIARVSCAPVRDDQMFGAGNLPFLAQKLFQAAAAFLLTAGPDKAASLACRKSDRSNGIFDQGCGSSWSTIPVQPANVQCGGGVQRELLAFIGNLQQHRRFASGWELGQNAADGWNSRLVASKEIPVRHGSFAAAWTHHPDDVAWRCLLGPGRAWCLVSFVQDE